MTPAAGQLAGGWLLVNWLLVSWPEWISEQATTLATAQDLKGRVPILISLYELRVLRESNPTSGAVAGGALAIGRSARKEGLSLASLPVASLSVAGGDWSTGYW
jgi:hypothetical protein